jgi:O-antigen ligase/tetratricopeptide (TPR) repeat protein
MSKKQPVHGKRVEIKIQSRAILLWLCVSLLALVPLIFSTAFYRIYVLPKFAILVVGSAAILALLPTIALDHSSRKSLRVLRTNHGALVSLYVFIVALSTFFGVVPLASLFGSYPNAMGLITRLCFFSCFIGLIVSIGTDSARLLTTVCVMSVTGSLVAAYAVAQFFGQDPFLSSISYTFNTPSGPVVRVPSTLGHSNYLGNFLLYTAPLTGALAVAYRGRARRLAVVAVCMSIAGIAFSGTRGAWLGLVGGAITFALLELRSGIVNRSLPTRRSLLPATAAIIIILAVVVIIALSPASHNIAVRARSIVTDRFTGSGRTLLWRDSIGMVPEFALIGSGPEAFSRVFPAHRSVKLAVHASKINNESSHNSYLDAAISFGLAGAVFYVAMTVSAFWLLLRSRRRAGDSRLKVICGGLIASLAAVVIHNVFIYDQIPTGLYFFAFMALALATRNVTKRDAGTGGEEITPASSQTGRTAAGIAVCACVGLVALALWYVMSLAVADVAIRQAFVSARARNFEELVANGERATRSAEPTGAYDFLYARALSAYVDAIPGDNAELRASREEALGIANEHALKSIKYTFTPGSNYLLLAYLALAEGNREKLMEFASEAVKVDPNYYNAHWLMAEAWLAEGDRDQAVQEAKLTLNLRPGHFESFSVLARARGEAPFASTRVQGLVERARVEAEGGRPAKAEEYLLRAIQSSNKPCPVCHRELALVYESENKYAAAIAEWLAYAREAPEDAVTEQVSSRMKSLEQK